MSKHAIIIIKNNENEFLQYYDNRWESFLFLNCKLITNFEDEVIDEVAKKLHILKSEISCNLKMNKIHTKYSESAKTLKEYHHYFYIVNIKELPTNMNKKTFKIDAIDYMWYSMDDLKNDQRIMKVNSDIVGFINEVD